MHFSMVCKSPREHNVSLNIKNTKVQSKGTKQIIEAFSNALEYVATHLDSKIRCHDSSIMLCTHSHGSYISAPTIHCQVRWYFSFQMSTDNHLSHTRTILFTHYVKS